MRFLPSSLENKLLDPKQTRARENAPELNLWIFRQVSPLREDRFLQGQLLGIDDITAVDIAVSHPTIGRESETIYIAYVSNGKGKYVYADYQHRMERHVWHHGDLELDASDISIAFNGTMPKDTSKQVEFITEENMWVFWVKDGACYGKQLNSNRVVDILVDSGCTKVDSIKAVAADYSSFDFGLCVFMIINGQLFYRQYINGTWYDAELVSAFSSYTLTDISVSRTWDYRLAIQAMDSDGEIHELFTQYQGIAKQNAEHISAEISSKGSLIDIIYHLGVENEHIETDISATSILYVIGEVTILSVYNEAIDNNYGKKIVIIVDKDLTSESVAASSRDWLLSDSNGYEFIPRSVTLGEDHRTITMLFTNFNLAEGQCSIGYSGNTIKFPANVSIGSIDDFYFTPIGLDPIGFPAPIPISISATESDGTAIEITFNQNLIDENVSENVAYFTVTIQEYDYLPGGSIFTNSRSVSNVSLSSPNVVLLSFSPGNVTSVQNAESITVTYGNGTLYNDNGDVRSFNMTFVPTGLEKKCGKPVNEHLNATITTTADLKVITYHETYENEHIEATILATGTLTNIGDL